MSASAIERYEDFVLTYPKIIKRVPLIYKVMHHVMPNGLSGTSQSQVPFDSIDFPLLSTQSYVDLNDSLITIGRIQDHSPAIEKNI